MSEAGIVPLKEMADANDSCQSEPKLLRLKGKDAVPKYTFGATKSVPWTRKRPRRYRQRKQGSVVPEETMERDISLEETIVSSAQSTNEECMYYIPGVFTAGNFCAGLVFIRKLLTF